jgi:hypothetical protein
VIDRLRVALYIALAHGAEPVARAVAGVDVPAALQAPRLGVVRYSRVREAWYAFSRPPGFFIEASDMREARLWYRSWIRNSPEREVGIIVHRPSGRIFVVQGSARGAQEGAEVPTTRLQQALRSGEADFDAPAHFHPAHDARTVAQYPLANTHLVAHPSRADIRWYARTALAQRRPYVAHIHYLVGPRRAFGRTDIRFDPLGSDPLITLWVRQGPNRGFRAAYNDIRELEAALDDLRRGVIPALRIYVPPRPPRVP